MGAQGAVACVTWRHPILLTALVPAVMPQQLVAPLSRHPPRLCATRPNWSDRNHRDRCQHGTAQGKTLSLSLMVKVEESSWAHWHSYRLVYVHAHPATAPRSPSGQCACNQEGHLAHVLVVWQSSSLLQGGITAFH